MHLNCVINELQRWTAEGRTEAGFSLVLISSVQACLLCSQWLEPSDICHFVSAFHFGAHQGRVGEWASKWVISDRKDRVKLWSNGASGNLINHQTTSYSRYVFKTVVWHSGTFNYILAEVNTNTRNWQTATACWLCPMLQRRFYVTVIVQTNNI